MYVCMYVWMYVCMYVCMNCYAAVDAMVIRFDKTTGAFEEKHVNNLETAFSAFKAALYLWRVSKVELLDTRTAATAPGASTQRNDSE